MPEGPEVEHAARVLQKWLRGRTIVRVAAPPSRVLRGNRSGALRALHGARLAGIERVGKYLLLSFRSGAGLLLHLGMSGHFLRTSPGERKPPHARVSFVLDDGKAIHFSDPRMFGRVAVHPAPALRALPEIARHGPDAIRDELDGRRLGMRLDRTKRPIKIALMDPTVIAGIGNIQATEALWSARIDPRRPASGLTRREHAALARAIRESLRRTLATLTTDELEYVSAGGRNPFVVYDREGEPCPRCHRPLSKIVQGGRSTTWCPHCQR